MCTSWCDNDDWRYYSFSQHGLDIHRLLMHNSNARPQSNLAEPPFRRPNTLVDCTARRGGQKPRVDRLTTSTGNHLLSRYSSDSSNSKNTGGGNNAPVKLSTATKSKLRRQSLTALTHFKTRKTGPFVLVLKKLIGRDLSWKRAVYHFPTWTVLAAMP